MATKKKATPPAKGGTSTYSGKKAPPFTKKK